MTDKDLTQTLIITLKSGDEKITCQLTDNQGIRENEMFWVWFMSCWENLGLTFVKEGIEKK